MAPPPTFDVPKRLNPQHGVKGVFYKGEWLTIEDIEDSNYTLGQGEASCRNNGNCVACPRSRSRNSAKLPSANGDSDSYDVVLIGAGCIGSAIARELSRYKLSVLILEAADDVTQGATKGNSGIVHAGYDDKPGSNRAKFCWPGNQMFPKLDEELRFGYQKNGSLVIALSDDERPVLEELKQRGETNGVKRLRIIEKEELFELEPAINPKAVAALLAPDAGNVIPYEFAIALAENAVDNGVELRIRREVMAISKVDENEDDFSYEINVRHWEPSDFVAATTSCSLKTFSTYLLINLVFSVSIYAGFGPTFAAAFVAVVVAGNLVLNGPLVRFLFGSKKKFNPSETFASTVKRARNPTSSNSNSNSNSMKCSVEDMKTGGSGSWNSVGGVTVAEEKVKARFVVNCAGGASDKIANMIGDTSFKIKPRLGDYMLLNRNQGHLAQRTLFPCPTHLGKGVLVQTTLWGNLILGPTARDSHKEELMKAPDQDIQEYIFSKCKALVPFFDSAETIHSFCGARAKSDRGDWIIETSEADPSGRFIHAAGIDSPGLAGAPAVAVEVTRLLKANGLKLKKDKNFNPNRAPIIKAKNGMRGLKMGPVEKDLGGPESNVICKCEKVTEAEVVEAMRRGLPIDSTQAIRKRTRAGMGHCQASAANYDCECRVAAIIARENLVDVGEVGGRPFPATSTLKERWMTEEEGKRLRRLQASDTKLVM